MGTGAALSQQPAQGMTGDDELDMLKQQAEAMSRQMQQIQQRIQELEQDRKNR
jgi:prefoldin subunit 5